MSRRKNIKKNLCPLFLESISKEKTHAQLPKNAAGFGVVIFIIGRVMAYPSVSRATTQEINVKKVSSLPQS
jgi:hypothetical protein